MGYFTNAFVTLNCGVMGWSLCQNIAEIFPSRCPPYIFPLNKKVIFNLKMTNLNTLRFPSTIAHLYRHSLLIPNIALNLRYISRVTGYDTIYYMVPKCPIHNVLENFPNRFDLVSLNFVNLGFFYHH